MLPSMWAFEEIERRWQALEAPEDGAIHVLIVRRGGGAHDTPGRIQLSPEGGIAGDRWARSPPRDPAAQLSLISRRAVVAMAGDDPAHHHLPGDNLVVAVDFSRLTAGARLRLGTALVEITAKPHTGCKKFQARLGKDAMRWVNAEEHQARHLRGLYARILEPGAITVGDRLERV
jgi:MOSC domain-containing protein YiiM